MKLKEKFKKRVKIFVKGNHNEHPSPITIATNGPLDVWIPERGLMRRALEIN